LEILITEAITREMNIIEVSASSRTEEPQVGEPDYLEYQTRPSDLSKENRSFRAAAQIVVRTRMGRGMKLWPMTKWNKTWRKV
jgi:hypothetical protein